VCVALVKDKRAPYFLFFCLSAGARNDDNHNKKPAEEEGEKKKKKKKKEKKKKKHFTWKYLTATLEFLLFFLISRLFLIIVFRFQF
jgi:cytoskeletal protein RodZ